MGKIWYPRLSCLQIRWLMYKCYRNKYLHQKTENIQIFITLLESRYYGPVGCHPHPSVQLQVDSQSKSHNFYTYWFALDKLYIFSDTFFLLANQSLDPNLQNIASDYIVHYDYDEVFPALLSWSSSLTSQNLTFVKTRSGPGQRDTQQGGDGRGQAAARLLHQEKVHQQVRGVQHAHHEGQNSYWLKTLHAQDCLFPFGVAYALQKDSPYTTRFNRLYLCTQPLRTLAYINSLVQVQQENPAVKGVRPNYPLDPARARPGRSEGWRRSEQYWRLSKRIWSK